MATRPAPRPRRTLMTADELFELDEWTPEGDKCYELIAGSWIARDPDTVVGCDLSFVRADRLGGIVDVTRHIPFAPDLAVEVRSPNDRKGREATRVARLLSAGVRLVWHIEPRKRRATIHAPSVAPEPLGEDGLLDGRDVVPGFARRLRDALDWR